MAPRKELMALETELRDSRASILAHQDCTML